MVEKRAQLNTVRGAGETAISVSSLGREVPETQLEKIIDRIAPPVGNNGSNIVTGDTHVERVSADNNSTFISPEVILSEEEHKFDN
jgi:hydrogenase maturation factor